MLQPVTVFEHQLMEFADVTFVNRTQLQLFVDRDSLDDGAVCGSQDDISLINYNARRSAPRADFNDLGYFIIRSST